MPTQDFMANVILPTLEVVIPGSHSISIRNSFP